MSSPVNGMSVIARTNEAVYLRLPQVLREPINGGCSCDYCKAHPNETPSWDTLSYTTVLQRARVFRTREEAEGSRCGNEHVVSVEDELHGEGLMYEEQELMLTSDGIPTDAKVIYLGVYAVSRHYGGCEEGGWWYNRYRYMGRSEAVRQTAECAGDDSEVSRRRAEIEAEYSEDQPRFDIYSAANDGDQVEVLVEDEPGDREYLDRPHYE